MHSELHLCIPLRIFRSLLLVGSASAALLTPTGTTSRREIGRLAAAAIVGGAATAANAADGKKVRALVYHQLRWPSPDGVRRPLLSARL